MYENAIYMSQDHVKIDNIQVDILGIPHLVPLDPANTDYANIMLLVEEGKLTIAPAE